MQSLLTRLLLGGGGGFSPAALFSSGAEGVWYDPSDTSTLFQDPTGATPVTAVEQPVGLMLDKSKGLVLGPELVTNGDFSSGTGWTLGANWTIGSGVASHVTGAAASISQSISLTSGNAYQITVEATRTAGNLVPRFTGGTNVSAPPINASGTYSYILFAVTGNNAIAFAADSSFAGSIDNVSVRELPGNHAISYNDTTARPTLSARVNLLTYSEEFDNAAAWVNTQSTVTANNIVAPDGTTTADTFVDVDGGTYAELRQVPPAFISGNTYTYSLYAKIGTRRYLYMSLGTRFPAATEAFFDLQDGVVKSKGAGAATATINPVGNGFYRCSITATANATGAGSAYLYHTNAAGDSVFYTGTGTGIIYIWGAQLIATNAFSANTYQRIAAATDYDTNGFPKYLRFDGSDDGMSTPANLNLTSTDKVTVFSGVRKLSDAVAGLLAELSADRNTNNGAWTMGYGSAASDYGFSSKGTISTTAASASSFSPPITNVLTGTGDISGDSAILRINGAQAASSTADQGTGNYGSYPLYIGSRNNGSNWLNGYLYGLTVVGAQLTTPQIESMESWTAQRTGITL